MLDVRRQEEKLLSNSGQNNNVRQAVVSGVLASIVVIIFIEPILTWLWAVISDSTLKWWVSLIDSAYSNASLGNRSISSVFVLALFVGLLINAILFISILQPFLKPWLIKKYEKREDRDDKTFTIFVLGLRIANIFLGAILVFLLLRILMLAFVDFQLNSSFERRMASLAPVITDQQYKEIRASWAKMDSREKYLQIQDEMEKIAVEKNVELPESLLK